MVSHVTRAPLLAVAIGTAGILAAGCSAGGGSASAGGNASAARPAAQVSPQQAVLLAARNSKKVSSFEATISLQATTASTGGLTGAGTLKEQLRPSLRAEMDIPTLSIGGQAVPGGLEELITPYGFYMKAAPLMQSLHTTKPWAEIQFSSLGARGNALQSLFSQIQSSSPVSQAQLLSTSKDVRKVGTSVINGVPVTEYAGSISMSQAVAALPASDRATLGKDIRAAGVKSAQFKIWIDGQHQVRKIVSTENGTAFSETYAITVTSYNQPAGIQLPTTAETYVIPASELGGAAGQGAGG